MSEQPEFYEDGSSVWPLEDGGYVAFAADGTPTGAVDADGEAFDPAGIEYPYDDDDAEYDTPDDVEQQIAELQEFRENFNPNWRADAYAAGAGVSNGLADQAWGNALLREAHNFAAELGRELTAREFDAVMRHHH